MKKKSAKKIGLGDEFGCLGDFSINNPICKKFCALKLRCAIERYQNEQMEYWEDMAHPEGIKFVF